MYDVVIIGAGPAGLMAARILRNSNADFLVIDSKKEIGLPLKCGEGIRRDGFEALFGHSYHDFITNRPARFRVCAGRTRRTIRADYLMLDRPGFEKWLADPVNDRLLLGANCDDILRCKGGLQVSTSKGTLFTRMVILANGCDYRIQKKFGLINTLPETIPCYGGIYKDHNLDPNTLYFFFNDQDATATWIFPKESRTANIGIGVYPRRQKIDLKSSLKNALEQHCPKAEKLSEYGGIFPNSGPCRTSTHRILVCGNAAGQVYQGAGEGIYFALKAGLLAGKTARSAVKKKDFSAGFLRSYDRAWKKAFGSQLRAGNVFNRMLLLGFRFRKLEKLFAFPSERELLGLSLHGRISLTARLAHFFAARVNLKRKRPHLAIRALWRLHKAVRG
jgi:digeranylgeranylglycerophospholipid reductase